MKNRMAIQAVVILGIAALFASSGVRTHNLAIPNLGDIGKAVSAVVLLAGAYDFLFWRWIPVPGRPPRLRGTWKMMLAPSGGQPNASMAKKTCYLRVQQTASTVEAKLLFDDAESRATTAILRKVNGSKTLLFFYDFDPRIPTDASPRRKGAVTLGIAGGELNGQYWNDVGTWGILDSQGYAKKAYDTYRTAAEGKYS